MPFEKGNTHGKVKKKGNKTWRPARMLDVRDKDPDFRYRWCDKDDGRMSRKLAEGWEYVSSESGISGEHDKRPVNVDGGAPVTGGLNEYRELVLMALPEELGKARDKWITKRTEQQTAALQHMDRDIARTVGPAAKIYGEINVKGND